MAATNSNVTVLCPNGRRQNVKVTANTRILEVIETVCQKQKYNPDDYNLKHNRTVLDVQVPFRYANLPNNVKLELVKASSPRSQSGTAVVALQLPSGERLQRSFDSSTSLWQLLQHWEKEGDRPSLTASFFSSDGGTLHPVCIYMREEIVGEARLKATTLKGLGLTGGRAIIRLLHREVKLPSAPEPAQPQSVASVNPAIPCNPTPENQMVSSQAPASCADQDTSMKQDGDNELMQEEGKCSITPDVVPQATCVENTPVDNKQVSSELPGDAARECSIPDNRDEMPMDTEMTTVKVEMEGPDFEMAECESSAASKPCTSKPEERVVRPKKEPVEAGATHFSALTSAGEGESGGRRVADDISHNPNSGAGLTVDEYAKRRIHSLLAREAPEGDSTTVERARREVDMIESQTGVALNDYARRRIQNLLEKEEKMVQSMQTALMESMVQAVRSQQPAPQPRHPAMLFSDFKFPESDAADSPGKGKKKAPSKRPALDQPCERNQLVFSADREMMMRHGPDDVPDEFFDVTVNDIQSMLSSLRHQSSETERDLETRAMRERREEQKMSQYEKVVVRVHFPERVILQGFFRPHETVEAVKEFVRSNLADKKQQFYLFITPPKTVLKDTSQTLFKAKLFPAALVYFGTQDTRDYNLHEEILCNLDSPLQAESAVAKQMNTGALRASSASQSSSGSSTSGAATSSAASSSSFSEGASGSSTSQGTPGPVSATSSQQKRQASPSSGSAVGSTKVPKWFKMGKK
ncbi:tether containing UBX domain for GLUT4-like [Diadema setosum]|uniref:tether containing UBX domain for GLUT4-like n=1 Tax=Diadema setosum TaxID=31175 RepID=UPI003B3A6AD0